MIEIFKDIEGYEGLYQISNYGNVKSLKYNKEKILKPIKHSCGYLKVDLCKERKIQTLYIHRLVAKAFIDNPNNYEEVNHKDEDKTNNKVENLEFCDAKYNSNYGTHTERSALSRSKQVMCVETGKIYQSLHQIERELGFSFKCVSSVCLGKLKTYKGYHWCYV